MYQRVTLIGTVSTNPRHVIRYFNNSHKDKPTSNMVTMVLVVTEPSFHGHTITIYFNVVAWGNRADWVHQTLAPGSVVLVEGKIRNRYVKNRWEKEVNADVIVPLTTLPEMLYVDGDAEGYTDEICEEDIPM